MKNNLLVVTAILLSSTQISVGALAQGFSNSQGSEKAMTDEQSIAHVMKKLFDKSNEPLKIVSVAVEDRYAVAGWLQGTQGGRALLQKEKGQWTIHLCGGDGLTQASTLVMAGVTSSAASSLSRKVALNENLLPSDQLKKLGLFQGVVKVEAGSHDVHVQGPKSAFNSSERREAK